MGQRLYLIFALILIAFISTISTRIVPAVSRFNFERARTVRPSTSRFVLENSYNSYHNGYRPQFGRYQIAPDGSTIISDKWW
ncbi:unnamed protein product, partial [Mesorhabditis belari]|uniref:Uncharacterized protein n=1 Tax=Mesorhabditis belari TaxID=2138241 RepID=A0AAF3ERC8_9BILA